jgi:hypothetical protein
MGKSTNNKNPLSFTTTDYIKYTGVLPECIPSGESSCNSGNRNLTSLFELILEKYCDDNQDPLDMDISELNLECLIAENPDIEIGEDLTLGDLLIYYKEHLCYIYTRLCDICCDECGGGETICELEVDGEEVSGTTCDFLQDHQYILEDHEERITELEESSGNDYIPEPFVIPINKFLNVQDSGNLLVDFKSYIKNSRPEFYISKTPNGVKWNSLTGLTIAFGNNGKLGLSSDSKLFNYTYDGETPTTGEDIFEAYLTDGSGNSYLFPISIYTVNACCSGDSAVSEEIQEFTITFNVSQWVNDIKFNEATIESIVSEPHQAGVTATTESGFVLKLNHDMGLGSYTALAEYVNVYSPFISTQNLNTNDLEVQLANAPYNISGTNVKIKVTITY